MKILKILLNDHDSAPDKIINELKGFYLNEEGILPILDIEDVKADEIGEKLKKSLEDNDKVVSIADNHSSSFPLIKAFSEKYENAGIIIFDGHPDCLNDDDLLPSLIKKSIIKKENIILIGIRNWRKEEFSFIKENKIRFFDMRKINELGRNDIIETMMETARNFNALYISIDMDVVDPAFAPGVNSLEPGGLTTRELLFFLYRLKKLRNLKAMDITEVNPAKDVRDITSKFGAKLIVEFC